MLHYTRTNARSIRSWFALFLTFRRYSILECNFIYQTLHRRDQHAAQHEGICPAALSQLLLEQTQETIVYQATILLRE